MAAPTTTKKPVKKLSQFLQEQQEPFILEIYLPEKGCPKKNSNFPTKFLKKGSREFGMYNCSKVLKAVYDKFISTNNTRRTNRSPNNRNGRVDVSNIAKNSQEIAETDLFSFSGSTSTPPIDSPCSLKVVKEAPKRSTLSAANSSQVSERDSAGEKETDADEKLRRGCMLDGEGRNIQELIQEVKPSEENSVLDKVVTQHSAKPRTITDESILSASIWNLLFHSVSDKSSSAELQEIFQSTSQLFKTKRVLQQTRQLLFDCVREVLERHGKDRSRRRRRRRKRLQSGGEYVGPESMGKIVCEKIKAWGQQSGDELNITQLLDFDLQDSVQEWSEFDAQVREISFEIADDIREDIQCQIVTDMIHSSRL